MERIFTPEQDEVVAMLYRDGMSLRDIARRYGCQTQAVTNALARTGTPTRRTGGQPRLTAEQELEVVRRYESGEPLKTIATDFPLGVMGLRKVVIRGGGQMRPRGATERDLMATEFENVLRRWQAGESQSAIARGLGLSQIRVNRALRAAGHRPENRRNRGERHGSWKGGRVVHGDGYALVLVSSDDPMASMRQPTGYVLEHRLVMARYLGRPLTRNETVHHINGDRQDNRVENLQLRSSRHGKGQTFRCRTCGSHDVESVELD